MENFGPHWVVPAFFPRFFNHLDFLGARQMRPEFLFKIVGELGARGPAAVDAECCCQGCASTGFGYEKLHGFGGKESVSTLGEPEYCRYESDSENGFHN